MTTTIPASEFTRNFGHYRMVAQRETVAVSSHGRITGYFIAPDEYEAFQRFKAQRSSFATAGVDVSVLSDAGGSCPPQDIGSAAIAFIFISKQEKQEKICKERMRQ